MNAGSVYARVFRAYMRREGVRLSAEEVEALRLDTAALDASIGGEGGDAPWLSPTEQRRLAAGESAPGLFRGGRDVEGAAK